MKTDSFAVFKEMLHGQLKNDLETFNSYCRNIQNSLQFINRFQLADKINYSFNDDIVSLTLSKAEQLNGVILINRKNEVKVVK